MEALEDAGLLGQADRIDGLQGLAAGLFDAEEDSEEDEPPNHAASGDASEEV